MTNFDAANTYYKSIKGPVAAGSVLRLRVVLPRSIGVRYCFLAVHEDNTPIKYISMTWEKTDGIEEHWFTDFYTPAPGVLFYHFEYETSWGRTVLLRDGKKQTSSSSGSKLWQLTVYSPDFTTPERFMGGIMYQIFPDRFYNSGKPKKNVPDDRILRTDVNALPEWRPDSFGKTLNNDYFCGDIAGITEKLDYIKSLEVDCIYINPVFEAQTNHRYDTANYMNIDPLLGTESDYTELLNSAHERGIKVIFDGVFSHTGADSIYFNKFGRYGNSGAYNDLCSPYYSWYKFKKSRDDYECWWGIDILPEVTETDPSFMDYITGENGVLRHWLKLGADGVRLDVADELPDEFLDRVRTAVKSENEQNIIIGEVWEDASNKISSGARRRYFGGNQLDSVMNYPFRTAIIDFLLTSNAARFMENVYDIVLNYPPQALNTCMNILGTHDTERILTALTGTDCSRLSREAQSGLCHSEAELSHAKKLLKTAFSLLYMLPGIPTIYYGDEAGLTGGKDPFNRRFFPWDYADTELTDFVRALGKIRKSLDVLKDGEFIPLSSELGCVAFLRYKPGLPRACIIANKNPVEIYYRLNFDMQTMTPVFGEKTDNGEVKVPAESAVILTDIF